MKRFHVRVEPPGLTVGELSAASATGIEDEGILSTSESFRYWQGAPESWRGSRVFAVEAEDEADAIRRVARALDRGHDLSSFDVRPALP